MSGIKNKLKQLSNNQTIPLSDYRLTSPFSQKGTKNTTSKGSPWVRGAVSHRLTEGSLSAGLSLTILTKYLGIACLSLAILSTLILNIISSYSSSKVNSNAEPVSNSNANLSTLANSNDSSICNPSNTNAASCISLSITSSSSSSSSSTDSNNSNLSLQIPREGGIAVGRHTVTVNSNNVTGWEMTLDVNKLGGTANPNAELINTDAIGQSSLSSSISTLPAANLISNATQLPNNTWGVALPYGDWLSRNYYDAEGSYLSNDQDILKTLRFSTLTGNFNSNVNRSIARSSSNTQPNTRNVYYGIRIDHPEQLLAGNYQAEVVYTATTREVPAPTITSIDPNQYELDSNTGLDTNNRLSVTITGTNLESTYKVYLESNTDSSKHYDITGENITSVSDTQLKITLPTDKTNLELEAGGYTIHVVTQGGEASVPFTYTKSSICRNNDPDSDCQVDIDDNMIPVVYEDYDGNGGGNWRIVTKEEIENNKGSWYDYSKKKWANAVTLRDDFEDGYYCGSTSLGPSKTELYNKDYANANDAWNEITSYGIWRPGSTSDCYTKITPLLAARMYDAAVSSGKTVIDHSLEEITNWTIYNDDVLGYWVYIPRYAYQVQRKEVRDHYVSDTLASNNGGFNIKFETADDFKKEPAETCSTEDNNMFYADMTGMENEPYYIGSCHTRTDYPTKQEDYNKTAWATHPAFSWSGSNGDGSELNGFWIGKFETTGSKSEPTVLPDQWSLTREDVGELYDISQSIGVEDEDNIYGNSAQTNYNGGKGYHNLATSKSHMLKNSEWGAAVYLGSSVYGAGVLGVYNNSSNSSSSSSTISVTGRGPSGQRYYTADGMSSSTTNSIYGVYDMAGGAGEYVSAVHAFALNENFDIPVEPPYINLYSDGDFDGDDFSNNNLCTWLTCGGHALYETKNIQFVDNMNRSWGGDNSFFVTGMNPWFVRGGYSMDYDLAGVFSSYSTDGSADSLNGSRAALLAPPAGNSG